MMDASPRAAGHESGSPLERVVTIMAVLQDAGAKGVPAGELVAAGRYGGAVEGQREQLQRDLRHLAKRGWKIDNIAEPGSAARYRLAQGDPRIRLHFTEEQRGQFARAAKLVGIEGDKVESTSSGRDPAVRRAISDAPGYSLALATHGHDHRCLMYFRYREKPRVVASDAIWLRDGRWYLVGREVVESTPALDWATKNFRLDRMSELALGRPGSAPDVAGDPELNIDPLTFRDGDPIEAVVSTHPDLRSRVEARLGTASSVRRSRDSLELTIPVTNRTTFRNRLYELNTRVRLIGPPELCDEVRDDLLAHVRARS